MKLKKNAELGHEDPEYWYDAYGMHISTERSGDVCIQEVDPAWLSTYADDDALIAANKFGIKLSPHEASQLVARARKVWGDACTLHYYRERAVHAYEQNDLEAVDHWLTVASQEERGHGYDPAASALRRQLIEEDEEDEE